MMNKTFNTNETVKKANNPACFLGAVVPCFSLNDNPRSQAEKRLKQLIKRRDGIIRYKSGRFSVEFDGCVAAKMFINPYVKSFKAGKMIDDTNKEIRKVQRFLSSFK